MTIQSLEQFDKEAAAKRAELERVLNAAAGLPTVGRFVEWTGENGWDEKGAPREPIAKRQELQPWILHGACAYKEAEHVAFHFGDGGTFDKGGEPTGSKFRGDYVRAYLRGLLDACEPFMLDVIAWRGTYASYLNETFDPTEALRTARDWKDAKAIARGRYLLSVDTHTGEHGYSRAELEFYISRPVPYKVSIDLSQALYPWKLAARPRYATSYGAERNACPDSWDFPHVPTAANVFKRASAGGYGRGARGYRLDYLFEKVEYVLEALGMQDAPA